MKKEQWKDIEGYEGMYQISSFGRIKSLQRTRRGRLAGLLSNVPERILVLSKNRDGYLHATGIKSGVKKHFYAHREVAIMFLLKINNKDKVNHIDGNKNNNCVENLEWCTQTENIRHARKIGLLPFKLSDDQVIEIRRLYTLGLTNKELCKKYNISYTHISNIITRKRYPHLK